MTHSIHTLVGAVNEILTTLATEIAAGREEARRKDAQAEIDKKAWKRPEDPRWRFAVPPCVAEAIQFKLDTEKRLGQSADKAAKAIFAAESAYSASCLRETAAATELSEEQVLRLRAAGDAVLRFAASTLRGYELDTIGNYLALARLLKLAERLPEAEDRDGMGRRNRLDSPIAPRRAPYLGGRLV